MALPQRIRVKLLPETAGYISSLPVIERDFTIAELLEALVSLCGKKIERLRQVLAAGSAVLGDFRYRWQPIEADPADLQTLLAVFPDPQPDRPFQPVRCVLARVYSAGETIELPRQEAARRRFSHKQSFWDVLMEIAVARLPRYQTYSYRERADVYVFEPTRGDEQALKEAAALLPLERAAQRIPALRIERIALLVNRP
jgi:hypothetical protein